MKKKSARDIPDFSRHPTQMAAGHGHGMPQPQQQGAKPARQAPIFTSRVPLPRTR